MDHDNVGWMREINKAVDEIEQSVYAWMEKHEALLFWIALVTLMTCIVFLLSLPVDKFWL